MSTQNGKKRKPWPMWGQVLALVVGVMLLFEGVYQANNAYLRYKLAPMFERAVQEAEVPEIAIFNSQDLSQLCPYSYDLCLEKFLDGAYSDVFADDWHFNECKNPHSKYCPKVVKTDSDYSHSYSGIYGLFNNNITITKVYVNENLSEISSYYDSPYPFWRPDIFAWIGFSIFGIPDNINIINCYKTYIPTFKNKWKVKKCPN